MLQSILFKCVELYATNSKWNKLVCYSVDLLVLSAFILLLITDYISLSSNGERLISYRPEFLTTSLILLFVAIIIKLFYFLMVRREKYRALSNMHSLQHAVSEISPFIRLIPVALSAYMFLKRKQEKKKMNN